MRQNRIPQQKLRSGRAARADPAKLAHNNTYDVLPEFYEDIAFVCKRCGAAETWTALQQKWWYEVRKASIHSKCKNCRACRKAQREKARRAKERHLKGLVEKYGLEDAARRLSMDTMQVETILSASQKTGRRKRSRSRSRSSAT